MQNNEKVEGAATYPSPEVTMPSQYHFGRTLGRDKHCVLGGFVQFKSQPQAKGKVQDTGFDWLTQILASPGWKGRKEWERRGEIEGRKKGRHSSIFETPIHPSKP